MMVSFSCPACKGVHQLIITPGMLSSRKQVEYICPETHLMVDLTFSFTTALHKTYSADEIQEAAEEAEIRDRQWMQEELQRDEEETSPST